MALELLRAQPGGPNVSVPLRFIDRKTYQDGISNAELNARIDAAPITDVPIDQIVAIQHTINKARVAQYIEKPNLRRAGTHDPVHGGLVDLPIVIRRAGVMYLHDGHHRCTAQKFLGASRLRVRFVDLDKEQK